MLQGEFVKASSIDDLYFRLIRRLFQIGRIYIIDQGSYVGHKRLEYDFISFQLVHPGTRPLTPIMLDGIPSVTTDEDIDRYYNEQLMSPEVADNEIYTYGEYVFEQVPKVLELLENSPRTNQATIMIGGRESIDQEHPPCLRLIDCKISGGVLHFYVYFRSWDLWGGLPENLGGLQLLKEDMSKALGVVDGQIFGCSKGLHLYDFVWPLALKRMNNIVPEGSVLSRNDIELGERWL